MTSATIHAETTVAEPVTVSTVTVPETGRTFVACDIGGVTLLISHATAYDLGKQLLAIYVVPDRRCERHDVSVDEQHECALCVAEDVQFDLADDARQN